MKKLLLILVLLGFFTAGYVFGSIHTRNAIAFDLGGLTGTSGTVQSLKNLGNTIIQMQENVNKLQTNINEVKKVRDDVANYQGIYDKVKGSGSDHKQQK